MRTILSFLEKMSRKKFPRELSKQKLTLVDNLSIIGTNLSDYTRNGRTFK